MTPNFTAQINIIPSARRLEVNFYIISEVKTKPRWHQWRNRSFIQCSHWSTGPQSVFMSWVCVKLCCVSPGQESDGRCRGGAVDGWTVWIIWREINIKTNTADYKVFLKTANNTLTPHRRHYRHFPAHQAAPPQLHPPASHTRSWAQYKTGFISHNEKTIIRWEVIDRSSPRHPSLSDQTLLRHQGWGRRRGWRWRRHGGGLPLLG